jgi:cytochrome c oxidase subunit 3
MSSAHHDEEHIHLPEPNLWPLVAAIGIAFLPIAPLLAVHTELGLAWAWPYIFAFGALIAVTGGLGWVTMVIREKSTIDPAWGNRCLSFAWKLFLLSEAAIFGAFFGALFYAMYHANNNTAFGYQWPPIGTPQISLWLPMLGTGVLVLSSVTCELAHKALIVGNRSLCKSWLFFTLILGFIFIAMQGYEWGHLITLFGFTPSSGFSGTIFYLITGFHGFHVITGLLMLFVVYARLEFGSFDRKRHFSMNAASWYWHFVDVIWLFVFFVLYCGFIPTAH